MGVLQVLMYFENYYISLRNEQQNRTARWSEFERVSRELPPPEQSTLKQQLVEDEIQDLRGRRCVLPDAQSRLGGAEMPCFVIPDNGWVNATLKC